MTDKEKMLYENQKKNPPIRGVSHLLIVNGKLLIRGGKRKERSRNESYDDKSFGWANEKEIQMAIGDDLMYVDNNKEEDQNFTAMKEPDQKKKGMFLLMTSMIQRMIYLTSIDIYELDHEVSEQTTKQ